MAGDISKDCAELLVDLAATVGTMQGLAAGGVGDADIFKDIQEAAHELIESNVCPVRDEDKQHLVDLTDRIKGLTGAGEVDMDAATAIQDDLNAFLEGMLGNGVKAAASKPA